MLQFMRTSKAGSSLAQRSASAAAWQIQHKGVRCNTMKSIRVQTAQHSTCHHVIVCRPHDVTGIC